ncbi:hypothetical protein TraAM80_05813 [Trypanosoma rangeli]|uniref:Uncharacterized protein n=2 Tax=Trypanosoma rangeli TaxID=5698 RepID=A0A3R7NJ57_TRYRA|nr:uncharacterized protein TraAM80_05813 [Trypanosoma rangeli]RNF03367.1 hypothetical protein TraAM80_05813 [Trypanosoma rangeli]|eukprot:RNF03367.1 hypothetical protein TraAM80_05813 [Trypanosoma rangeli]
MHAPLSSSAHQLASVMSIETFIRKLATMYTAQDNETRRAATMDVLEAEDRMGPEEILQIGVGLLRVSDHGVAVQAYGAVLLRRAVASGRLAAEKVPYSDIMMWYLNEPSLCRLLCGDLVDLITECMLYEWPERYPHFMEQVCPPQAQLAKHPRKVRLLSTLVVRLMDPHLGNVPLHRMKQPKRALSANTSVILVETIQALFDLYTAAGGERSQELAEPTRESIIDCLTITVNLASGVPVRQWWEVGLGNTLSVLVRWPPVAQEALAATTALLKCDEFVRSTTALDQGPLSLVAAVLGCVEACVMERNYSTLEELTELLLEMPNPILEAVVAPVSQSCLAMLSVPSIYMATAVCHILKRLGDAAFAHINALELMMRFAVLIPKNKFHPRSGTGEQGKKLSEQQYGSTELFERGFGEFRGLTGHLLTALARVYPVVSNQFILQLLMSLCDGCGSAEDPRTLSGFVTQQSNTFCEWEATQFLIDHLSESFRYSSDYVPQAIAALVAKQTEDMVLCPVYLNMLSAFWGCRDDTALGVWEGTLGIICACLERKPSDPYDIDVRSARKRALTLLVTACSQHGARLACVCEAFMKKLEQLLMMPSTMPQERTLLYEALAALTNVLPDDEGQRRLQSFFTPVTKMLMQRVQTMDQARFNSIITAQTTDLQGERDMLRDGVVIVAGVVRRCKICPYLVEAFTELMPCILRLMEFIHSLRPEQLPAGYACILDMERDVREQYLPGRSRKSMPRKNSWERARLILMDLRMSLYQVVGALSTFLPAEPLLGMLQMLTASAELLPTHAMRSLIVHCMFPIGTTHVGLIASILPICGAFFARVTQRAASARPEDDVIDKKQLFYLSKEVYTFMRRQILEKNLLVGKLVLAQVAVEVALSMLESGSNVPEASRFIDTVVEATKKGCGGNSALEAQVEELAVGAFGRMLDFAGGADDAMLPFKDCERLLFALADVYVDRYPEYTAALHSRFPQDRIDELHAQLVMSHRFDLKRRRFKDFVLQGTGKNANGV